MDVLTLRSTETSPFGRKVRIAIDVLGLGDRISVVAANTLDDNDTLRQQNPLGKMPCLLLPDGGVIYDSGVIIEYLQELVGTDRLLPVRGPERYRKLTLARLADGITEAGLLMVYEGRFRDSATTAERWLAHQRGKVTRALAAFERDPPPPDVTDIVSIGLSCALGYLDWREPVAWRRGHPRLVQWLDDFARHEAAFDRTGAHS
ncbi:MAG: glutathione S-transferase N-terminal domain-containing protein [Pseudolabrys sp.]|jgi:glutathione S-transferase